MLKIDEKEILPSHLTILPIIAILISLNKIRPNPPANKQLPELASPFQVTKAFHLLIL
jgi:hypothetical protein